MALGPQPKVAGLKGGGSGEGADWLRDLQHFSGMYTDMHAPLLAKNSAGGVAGDEDMSDSQDEDDSDAADSPKAGKKRGRGKAPKRKGSSSNAGGEETAADVRKAQNRLAQRFFRQRKSQYVRALEARVELLSSDHDTQVDRLRYALRGLLAENNQLRQICAVMARFIGDQVGGVLQQNGMTREELEELVLGSSEKTMTESWQNWPGATESEALRQIRLESNLPPEGLPESNKLPEHAKVNTAKKQAEKTVGSTAGNGPDGGASKSGQKRKASTPIATENNSGSKQQAFGSGLIHSSPTNATPTSSVDPLAPSLSGNESAQALASFFAQGQPNFASPAMTPGAFGFTPTYSGVPAMPGASQGVDSNAILASLFGSSGMAGFMGTNGSNPSTATLGGTDPAMTSQALQRTIGGAEEPDEIRRINVMVAQLKKERERYGAGKDPEELRQIADALHELIRQMATFRRQPSYHLPTVLEPSEIQQTRPHDPLIDALPFPGIRRNLIAQQDSLVIEDVILSILHFSQLHPGDVLNENNWELLYGFLIAYPQLVDQKTLDNSNRWRVMRNESKLTLDDIAPGHV
jgi:hypothetical protein